MSTTIKNSDPIAMGWKNSVFIKTLADIQNLKNLPTGSPGSKSSDIQVHGSGELVQLLLKNDLVDEFWLKIFPLTLGKGKKLFDSGMIPSAFSLIERLVTPSGVIFANYKRAGKVETGTIGS